jgi:predicted enzyme related to lactoylglutathione lyase
MNATLNPLALVIFAEDKGKVSSFYQCVLGLTVIESASSHDLLSGSGYEIVVHVRSDVDSTPVASSATPEPRSETPIKPIFTVSDFAQLRAVVIAEGGALLPLEQSWKYRGCVVLDGWDPEGNVLQFRCLD